MRMFMFHNAFQGFMSPHLMGIMLAPRLVLRGVIDSFYALFLLL